MNTVKQFVGKLLKSVVVLINTQTRKGNIANVLSSYLSTIDAKPASEIIWLWLNFLLVARTLHRWMSSKNWNYYYSHSLLLFLKFFGIKGEVFRNIYWFRWSFQFDVASIQFRNIIWSTVFFNSSYFVPRLNSSEFHNDRFISVFIVCVQYKRNVFEGTYFSHCCTRLPFEHFNFAF